MRIDLDAVRVVRDSWSVSATGTFTEGIHLISGDVGSGKTTLARVIAGLSPPTSGAIRREDITHPMISFQFPEHHVTGSTVSEECSSWGLDPTVILKQASLQEKAGLSPLRLSRGELKRLHLACVLSQEYDLLVLDEPFSSLDCKEKARACTTISGRARGITIIFTHEQSQFPRVDMLWEIVDGSLHCRGNLPDALRTWEHAPEIVRALIRRGKEPANLTRQDIREAACRT
ncbi:ATP-binding cassette domain-containing protein [Methanoregula formicica]|uniref:ABC-type cobalt transport system, ATPase component n=1 Tax=Methanoregula formicica (strain DSM 22288 / NBRC 105244 / SMSP) TaxID=593750 RepID=L0HEC1_METFS|nr:ATP-binding cassette domain-containing protein [Methanoregula formicica]AGB02360.1 ABC-type cobalt transport system, ATPase component [Methanoregula formicica SMSP]